MKYISQLDGVRAIAVISVIISHWAPKGWMITKFTKLFNGVDVFFVLSGFLITMILLHNREKTALTEHRNGTVMKSFFMRRALRIFPIYYLALAIIYFIGDDSNTDIRSNYLYFFTYTSNFYFFQMQSWNGMLSHLWSLSVEEQFYLVWPWLMLYCKKKHVLPVILVSIFTGLLFQLIFKNVYLAGILTFTCLDAFGVGALLAYIQVNNPSFFHERYKWILAIGVVSLALMILHFNYRLDYLSARNLTAVFMFWLIVEILLKGEKKSFLPNYVFNNPLLVFMGKISYGLYLYHMMIPHFTRDFLFQMNSHLPAGLSYHNNHLVHLENFILLIGISYLSYLYIEMPFLGLKKRFEYRKASTEEKVLAV